jgi:glycerol-3-phosphate acyltransferase PlsX
LTRVTIAIDAMGGDHGPSVIVPACLQALDKNPRVNLVLVGDTQILQQELSKAKVYDASRLSLRHASQRIEMDESPTQALRYKKDSSMRLAINMVKEGEAQACVSAGNTGALMAIAHFVLKSIAGIDRPAIVSTLPSKGKDMRMLDLGANVDSSAMNLVQFAIMGSVLAATLDNIPNPKVYLLNIGEEVIKGNKQVKETAQLLADTKAINYCGFIEGDNLYKGVADIVVCDGFVGNVALKSSEGAALLVLGAIKKAFNRNFFTKFTGFLALPVLKAVLRAIDPSRYNGATFLGLKGIVVKSHGSAKAQAFENAIAQAIIQVEKDVLNRISAEIERLVKSTSWNK